MSLRATPRLSDIVLALTTASDMISPAVSDHGKRVAYIAFKLGQALELPPQELHDVVVAGALHDIGALGLRERLALMQFESVDAGTHAELGYLLLRQCPLLERVASIVRHHHVEWNHGQGAGETVDGVPLGSHILHLADRVDSALSRRRHPLQQVERIIEQVNAARGERFKNEIVDAFTSLSIWEYFWLDASSAIPNSILSARVFSSEVELTRAELASVARMASHMVDFKSTYTSRHSAGVAAAAAELARLIGFSAEECGDMLIAGYLHDIGKLSVPTEILDKPGPLTVEEYSIVRGHTYYTRLILDAIPGFEHITEWAASHHERLNGEGYPYHFQAGELPLGSRILAVADAFSALTEDRPYRGGMARQDALHRLELMVEHRQLDGRVLRVLKENYESVEAQRVQSQEAAQQDYRAIMQAVSA